ncbi:MAG: Plasmid stabilization system [Candidatus Gallionella acididurans]|uniref:Plasmid stabilization system n=1 Tax=Candidatus Gallionella acididurans TaxID=1796491 RepID=A0A139BRW5_9PROT|nr:MAG: Plasmid stabilization system [Candidatus Gallionella acididurans]
MNTIEWSAKAVRQLRKIADKRKRQSIFAEAQHLANWPDCQGDIKRLQGRDGYRLRVSDHRVIFEIDQSGTPIIVTIIQVEKRNERTY